MVVTIHQPEHMPWLGFFHKIAHADTFVILDNVQFRKNYFQNRNKIRTKSPKGWNWITVPISFKFGDEIKDVKINSQNFNWKKKYWESIQQSYGKTPYFDTYSPDIKTILMKDFKKLSEINLALILKLIELLGIKNKIMLSSQMEVNGKSTSLLLDICKSIKAETYFSGISGKEYLDFSAFEKAGIKLSFQEFHHPIYKQIHGDFLSCMSVIDLLFNYGKKSMEIIHGVNTPVMGKVFS